MHNRLMDEFLTILCRAGGSGWVREGVLAKKMPKAKSIQVTTFMEKHADTFTGKL